MSKEVELRDEEGETGGPGWFVGEQVGRGWGIADIVGYDAEWERWVGGLLR